MHKFVENIKKFESSPFVVKDFINEKEILLFQKLYKDLPIEIDNKRQKIVKKKWSKNYYSELQEKYMKKLQLILNDFEMDNPKTKNGLESLGLFQESSMPVSLHVDTGFDFEKIIHQNYLKHEEIENLKGLEVDLVYKWKVGDLLIFDRTCLHCASSNLKEKKIGFTSSTIKI